MKYPALSYYMHDGPTASSIELAGALAAQAAKKLEQDSVHGNFLSGEEVRSIQNRSEMPARKRA